MQLNYFANITSPTDTMMSTKKVCHKKGPTKLKGFIKLSEETIYGIIRRLTKPLYKVRCHHSELISLVAGDLFEVN